MVRVSESCMVPVESGRTSFGAKGKGERNATNGAKPHRVLHTYGKAASNERVSRIVHRTI
ncbi:hypothetical protein FQN51_003821, partial [Onygenales sp. PD_10]